MLKVADAAWISLQYLRFLIRKTTVEWTGAECELTAHRICWAGVKRWSNARLPSRALQWMCEKRRRQNGKINLSVCGNDVMMEMFYLLTLSWDFVLKRLATVCVKKPFEPNYWLHAFSFSLSLLLAAPSRMMTMMRCLTRRGCWLPKCMRVTSRTSWTAY